MTTRWIPLVEQRPHDLQVVIVGQTPPQERVFAGWFDEPGQCWMLYDHASQNNSPCVRHVDLRATDFWLPLPEHPPTDNVFDGVYPA
jgi:hypothetical protein